MNNYLARGLIFLLVFLCLLGCSQRSKKSVYLDYSGRIIRLSNKIKKQQKIIQDLQDRNSIMTTMIGRRNIKQKDISKQEHLRSQIDVDLSEKQMYKEVQQAFIRKNLPELVRLKVKFLNRFPISVFADNVIYLQGQLELNLDTPKRSISSFNELLKSYPSGNKAASAMLGKAKALRKLKKDKSANLWLVKVIEKYPGSPESMLAQKLHALIR